MRKLVLKLAENESLVRMAARLAWASGLAQRFVAGKTLTEAVAAAQTLNRWHLSCSLNLLGEKVESSTTAAASSRNYVQGLEAISVHQLDSNISVKLTQLGLGLSRQVCADNLEHILQAAASYDNFVRIDMEDSSHTTNTIELFEEAFKAHGNRVGLVIQAYLFRSDRDLERLIPLGGNIRLCKGAYREPAGLAYANKKKVDLSYVRMMRQLLQSSVYTALATHDEKMIDEALRFIDEAQVPGSRYEFQMLYGVRRDLQERFQREGHRVRVYVPFGSQWAPYLMRRLGERPANLLFVLRHLFRK